MELINFERQVNQDLYYAILKKGFGSETIIESIDFENEVFKISPYDWNEPENPEPNFIHKPSGFKLWWYKYPLRSPKVNFNITHEEFSCILYDCVNSISKFVKFEIDKFWENRLIMNEIKGNLMINKLIITLETMNKLKGFKSFTMKLTPEEIIDLYSELLEVQSKILKYEKLKEENERIQKNLDFMIDKNDEKQDKIDKVLELINNSLLYGIMGSGKNFYSTIIKEVRVILTGGDSIDINTKS